MRIHAIQTGSVTIRERQRVGADGPLRQLKMLTDDEWTEPLPILAWLIEHPEGLIVVDTGDAFVIIAGDASYTERSMLDAVVDGVSSDPKAMRASHARLRELVAARSATYLPTHDRGSVARLQALG